MVEPSPGAVGGELLALARELALGAKAPASAAYEATHRWFEIASVIAAIAGIGLAVIGAARTESRTLAISSVAIAGVALTWQYLVIGIVAAVFLIVVVGVIGGAGP